MNYDQRKEIILKYLKTYSSISNREAQALTGAHRNTISKDLSKMITEEVIRSSGTGKGTTYYLSEEVIFTDTLLADLCTRSQQEKIGKYLKPANRQKTFFNSTLVKALSADFSFLTEYEKRSNILQNMVLKKRSTLSEAERKRRKEKLTVDLSWASSNIEGNTYTLLETEVLIKYNETTKGRSLEEAQMIINHKNALNYIRDNSGYYRTLS
ncbi:MAG: hypothetical protein ABIH39_04460, partial [Candidatus Margulisiibacteriota bacterium]